MDRLQLYSEVSHLRLLVADHQGQELEGRGHDPGPQQLVGPGPSCQHQLVVLQLQLLRGAAVPVLHPHCAASPEHGTVYIICTSCPHVKLSYV